MMIIRNCTALFFMLWWTIGSAPAQSSDPPIAPVSSGSTVVQGDTVALAIEVGTDANPVQELFGISFQLHFDTSAVEIVGVEAGSLLDTGGTLLTYDDDVGDNPTPYSITRTRPDPGVDGSGPVAVFDVVVLPDAATGDYTFSLEGVEAVDPDGDAVALSVSSGTLTVSDTAPNRAPSATDDTAELDEDASLAIDVLANDTDPDGDAIEVTAVSSPSNGTVSLDADHTIEYTPDPDFHGMDAFTYTVDDGSGLSDQAAVTVTVLPVNDPPEFISVPDTAATEGQPYSSDVATADVDGEAPLLSAPTLPSWLTLNDAGDGTGTLTGTPEAAAAGEHAVVLEAFDGSDAVRQSFTIDVAAVHHAPVAVEDSAVVAEDGFTTIEVLANDSNLGGDTLEVTGVSMPPNGTSSVTGDHTIEYTPDADFHGMDAFTYTIGDDTGRTDQATVTVTVTPVNDPPTVAATPPDVTRELESGPVDVDLEPLFSDVDDEDLTYAAVAADASVATATVSGSSLEAVLHGAGSTTIHITAEDSSGATASTAFDVTVTSPPPPPPSSNDDPVAVADTAETAAGVAVSISVLENDSDPDGDDLTLAGITQPSNGRATVDGSAITYTPDSGFTGSDSFGYTIDDEAGGSANATVVVTVTALADLAVTAQVMPTTAVPGTSVTVKLSVTNAGPNAADDVVLDADLDADLAAAPADIPAGCTLAASTLSCNLGTIQPESSAIVSFSGQAPDSSGRYAIAASAVSPVDDPAASNDSATAVLFVEIDEDGVPDSVEDGAPNDGDGNGDGIPDSEQENVASLTNDEDEYVTIASPDDTKLKTVAITANSSPDDMPDDVELAVGMIEFGIDGVASGEATTVTIHIPTAKAVTSYWKYGPTADNSAPHWYEFLYDGETGAEIFSDRVVLHFVDGERGDGDLTVNGSVDDPGAPVFSAVTAPAAADDDAATSEDEAVDISILVNDDANDGSDSLRIVAVTQAAHGSTAVSGSVVTYTPDADFFGEDTFTYTVRNLSGISASATVNVSVEPVNDAPTEAEITAPGASVVIAGDPDDELVVEWTASEDVDGDPLSYTWQLAAGPSFADVLLELEVGAGTRAAISYETLAGILDAAGADPSGEVLFYHRILTEDGEVKTHGPAAELAMTRGAITARGAEGELPAEFALGPNYPNPFNPATRIEYALPVAAHVRLEVLDMLGRRVKILVDEPKAAGRYELGLRMDGLSSGVYLYRLEAEGEVRVRRMVLAK